MTIEEATDEILTRIPEPHKQKAREALQKAWSMKLAIVIPGDGGIHYQASWHRHTVDNQGLWLGYVSVNIHVSRGVAFDG